MPRRQPSLPNLWLISDARNDAVLEDVLRRLPRGSGFVFRHYHLAPADRRARFEALLRIARARKHWVVLSGSARQAARWGADGNYCAPAQAGASGSKAHGRTRSPPARRLGLCLMTAHSLREIGRCRGAHSILLSPVFPTRSHPAAPALGPLRFRLLAARARVPVIALGGMDTAGARRLRHPRWAAIDGLIPKDS